MAAGDPAAGTSVATGRAMRRAALILMAFALAPAAAAQETPAKPWSTSAGAGLALTSGNSDTRNINLNFNTAWDPKTVRRFKADAVYLRGESDGETNVDKAAASARYERSIEQRAFWFGEVSYLRDPLKEIDYLVAPIAGAGLNLIKDAARTLGDALYHFDAGITTTIAARAELKVAYLYDYKNQPPPDVKKGDSALFAALLFKW
jgi:putative salt-induced outer membrane protein YdiY